MALVPPGVVTVTSTGLDGDCAGAVTVILVEDETVTEVPAIVPNFTVAPVTKPVPVIVTDVPPAVGPALGLTAVTVGVAS